MAGRQHDTTHNGGSMSPVRSIATTLLVGPAIAFGVLAGGASAAQAADHPMGGHGGAGLGAHLGAGLKLDLQLAAMLGLGAGGGHHDCGHHDCGHHDGGDHDGGDCDSRS